MAGWDTFGDLKDRVRDNVADHTDRFYSANEIGYAINEGQWELFKLLHSANVGFFFNSTATPLTINSSSDTWDLGKDFASVDEIIPTNDTDKFRKFTFRSRHAEDFRSMLGLPTSQLWDPDEFFYDVVSDQKLMIVPRPLSSIPLSIYTIDVPPEMTSDSDTPTIKKIFRSWIVEYASIKLKGKEESGEYISHAKLIEFLSTNILTYTRNRGGTNPGVVSEFDG